MELVDKPVRYRVSVPTLLQRYKYARKCISSKSAWLLLLLNFYVDFFYMFWCPPNFVARQISHRSLRIFVHQGSRSFNHLLYPLAGILADNKIGRYKMIRFSTWIIVPAAFLSIVLMIVETIEEVPHSFKTYALIFVLALVSALITVSVAGVGANCIQFGLEQLIDSPWEDQSIFIHWYIWIWNLVGGIVDLYDSLIWVDYGIDKVLLNKISSGVVLTIILSSIVLLCITFFKRNWFFIDLRRHNPYKLVYKVTKFSRLHKVPVNRSAFTYCEDEIPSGLDLAKTKYGGSFTTEEVEDVKAFYGILKVIFTIGPAFLLFSTFMTTKNNYKPHITFQQHNSSNITPLTTTIERAFFLNLTVFIIPLYLVIIRPFVSYYIPSMLKRMAVGIVVPTLLAVIFLVVDSLAHAENKSLQCMFYLDNDGDENPAAWSKIADIISRYYIYIITICQIVSSFTKYMATVALIEFICSLSPHSMKGLLIGLCFAIKGLYMTLGTVLAVAFHYSWNKATFPSCGMTYYLINIVFGLVALSLYVYVTRGYQYRMRDEPCHVHRYVEEYYSKIQEEENY